MLPCKPPCCRALRRLACLVNDADHLEGSLLSSFDAELSQFGRKKTLFTLWAHWTLRIRGKVLRLADVMERCAENGSMQKDAIDEVS